MSEAQPKCPRCGRPIQDTAYICWGCGDGLRGNLRSVERVAGDVTLTVARLDRMTRTGGATGTVDEGWQWHKGEGALFPTPLPVNLEAAAQHDAAAGELTTWARHVIEERGITPIATGHPLASTAVFLRDSITWLSHRPEADEAFACIESACWTIVRIVDRPADRTVVGRCPCGTYLYANKGADDVKCNGCGTAYDVEASRDLLRRELEDRLLTAGQIATMAAYLGLTRSRESARLLINVWADRGRIVAHGRVEGDPAYRFGEVLPRLLAAHGAAA